MRQAVVGIGLAVADSFEDHRPAFADPVRGDVDLGMH